MFSSTDTRGNRHLHAFALRPGIRRELDLPRSLETDLQRVLVFPTASAPRSLAAALAHVPSPDAGPLAAIEPLINCLEPWLAVNSYRKQFLH